MNDVVFQIGAPAHIKALHLLDEINRQAGVLNNEYEQTGYVIEALADSISQLLRAAQQVRVEEDVL